VFARESLNAIHRWTVRLIVVLSIVHGTLPEGSRLCWTSVSFSPVPFSTRGQRPECAARSTMSVMHFLWMAGVSCHDVLRQHVPWQASMRLYADTGWWSSPPLVPYATVPTRLFVAQHAIICLFLVYSLVDLVTGTATIRHLSISRGTDDAASGAPLEHEMGR
jgi:hypothetical protein